MPNNQIKSSWPLGKGAGVYIKDGALPTSLCRDIVAFFAERPHMTWPGMTSSGVISSVKTSIDSVVGEVNPNIKDEDEAAFLKAAEASLFSVFGEALFAYVSEYPVLMHSWTVRQDTGYQYQAYPKGEGFYVPHIDGSPFVQGEGKHRVLASVMYLNTVTKGGGTHFSNFDYTCDAVEGRILMFPSTFLHLHEGLVPLSVDKHIISTFVVSP